MQLACMHNVFIKGAKAKEGRRKQGAPIGGGLPFELQARKALADILVGAVEDVKKRLALKELKEH